MPLPSRSTSRWLSDLRVSPTRAEITIFARPSTLKRSCEVTCPCWQFLMWSHLALTSRFPGWLRSIICLQGLNRGQISDLITIAVGRTEGVTFIDINDIDII